MFSKKNLFGGLVFCLVVVLCSPASAAFMEISDPGVSFDGMPASKVQDSGVGQAIVASGYVPSVNVASTASYGMATGVPLYFEFTYTTASSGQVSFYMERSTSGSSSFSSFSSGFTDGFVYVRLNVAGDSGGTVEITNLTINGTNLGTYASGTTDSFIYFSDNNSLFTDLTITGEANFSAFDGGGVPKFEFALAPVPVPPSALLLGSGLLGLGLLGWRRQKRQL
jgi:hypothetical protein